MIQVGRSRISSRIASATPIAGPSAAPRSELHTRVDAVLQQIRPAVVADGGDVELIDVTPDGTARVRFHGACVGCPSSSLTLHIGIERAVRAGVPEVLKVIAV